MTPEQRFQKDFSYVLNKIKERSLYTLNGQPIEYKIFTTAVDLTGDSPMPEDEMAIIAKLHESEAIKIVSGRESEREDPVLELEVMQPKFDEAYKNGYKITTTSQPTFDKDSGAIKWAGKECVLPFKKIEYCIAEALFENPEAKVIENDLIAATDVIADKADSSRRIYDAMQRINKKVKAELSIDKLINYSNSHYWINKI